MFIDSHCHLHLIDLTAFNQNLAEVIELAKLSKVTKFLSVCVELADYPILTKIADEYPEVSISLGLHPNYNVELEPSLEQLCQLANSHTSCIAIGETGLDYYRQIETDKKQQQQRFRNHIQAARNTNKSLIVHTRFASEDTIKILEQEKAYEIGGVMHCFTEDWQTAKQALDNNFYISLSGIVTFKNAAVVQELARKIPLNRLLIETDSPYLAPVPYRGKINHPALLVETAKTISELRGVSLEELAYATSQNFYRCFPNTTNTIKKMKQ